MTDKTPMEIADDKFSDFKNGKATKEETITAIDESIEYLEKEIRNRTNENN